MKVSVSNRGYTLTGIDSGELKVIMYLLGQARDRCFREQNEDGSYYDGGDFVAVLSEKERCLFHRFIDGFWDEFDTMVKKINLKNR